MNRSQSDNREIYIYAMHIFMNKIYSLIILKMGLIKFAVQQPAHIAHLELVNILKVSQISRSKKRLLKVSP